VEKVGTQLATATTGRGGRRGRSRAGRWLAVTLVVLAGVLAPGVQARAEATTATTITYDGPTVTVTGQTSPHIMIANDFPVVLSARLQSAAPAPMPVMGGELTFTLGTGPTAQSCTGVTNGDGKALCTIASVAQPLGPLRPVSVRFDGDADHSAATESAAALIYAFPSGGGAFVIGDLATTSLRTFWGQGWSAANSLSGGPSPQGFLGFARNPTAPTCGGRWHTTDGPPPSAPLPDYMGVIETSSVTSSGEQFSGATARIVVLRTTEYGPVATQTGRGTYVTGACMGVPTRLRAAGLVTSAGRVQATLTANGIPVRGETVTFTAGDATLCRATTNALGVASCSPPPFVFAIGYDASYAGNPTYLPSTAHAGLF
jgi:hypothetical protein